MKITVGLACLVTMAVLGEATDVDNHLCKVVGGACQLESVNCVGTVPTDNFFCNHLTPKQVCCVPPVEPPPTAPTAPPLVPGCVYGSKALQNGAVIELEPPCIKLKCNNGKMEMDESMCPQLTADDFASGCKGVKDSQLLDNRCFVVIGLLSSWPVAREGCAKLTVPYQTPGHSWKLASFAGITQKLANIDRRISLWTGGSNTAKEDTLTWLGGKTVRSSGIKIPKDCLSVTVDLLYKEEHCTKSKGYICELIPVETTLPCECNTNEHGCTLGMPNIPNRACQCKLEVPPSGSGTVCTGTVVDCKNPDSLACKNPGVGFENCMQGVVGGQGNCCGYAAAKCWPRSEI